MKLLKLALPALLVAAGLVLSASNSFAKPEYSKKEKKGCTVCHIKAGQKDLNETGKYYQEHKTLEGYKAS